MLHISESGLVIFSLYSYFLIYIVKMTENKEKYREKGKHQNLKVV